MYLGCGLCNGGVCGCIKEGNKMLLDVKVIRREWGLMFDQYLVEGKLWMGVR